MSILLKISSLCILTLALNGCLLTIAGGAIGIADSLDKNRRMDGIESRINKLEKANETKKPKPYVPSYTEMDTFTKGFYDTMYNRDGK
jgi:hypothetical protein